MIWDDPISILGVRSFCTGLFQGLNYILNVVSDCLSCAIMQSNI